MSVQQHPYGHEPHDYTPFTSPDNTMQQVSRASSTVTSYTQGSSTPASPQAMPKKRRGQYSDTKCEQCRKDKQKCLPIARSWPGEKCDRCQDKGYPCSEGLKTAKRQKKAHTLSPQEVPSIIETSFKNCLDTANWVQMLRQILEQINCIESTRRPKDISFLSSPTPVDAIQHGILRILEELELVVDTKIWMGSGDKTDKAKKIGLLSRVANMHSYAPTGHNFFDGIYYDPWDDSLLSAAVELLRAKGEILAAMRMQRNNILKIDYLYRKVSSIHDYTRELDTFYKLQEEFWDNNRRILEQLPTILEVPNELICPSLHDHLLPSSEGYLTNASRRRDTLGRTLYHTDVNVYGNPLLGRLHPGDLNAQDIFGRTPLHIMCSLPAFRQVYPEDFHSWDLIDGKQCRIVEWLLSRDDIKIDIRDCDGRYAAEYAILDQNYRIVRLFRDNCKVFLPESEVGVMVLEALKYC